MALLGQLTAASPPDEVAEAIIVETKRRGYSRGESVAAVSTGLQESGLRMVWSPNRLWFGYFQQDASYKDRMLPDGNIRGFLDRLDGKRRSPGASPDPFKNIFWLQQRPSDPSADAAYTHPKARRAYLDEIRRHITRAEQLYDRYASTPPLTPPPAARFWPMKSGTYTLSSPFGPRPGGMHYGTDFAAKDGTPIYAAAAGTVAHIGAAQGFGQWIVLQHDGSSTVYGHMWNAAATGLRQGDRVTGGQLIAHVGNNGQSTGAHLHFEVHPGAWRAGSQIDPAPWLATAAQPGGGSMPPLAPAPVAGRWTGDPVWLADVLRAEGLTVIEHPGWRTRGHGDFKDIRGVMVHHTGSDNATAASIATGRPDLPGPLSQIHIARDGTVTLVAVGVAWHAGKGSYPWLPTDMGNWHLIGIEAANSGTSTTAAHRTNWPDAQYNAIVGCCAAINRRLARRADRTIGHKEYAGRAQGKWDPGAIDMDVLRADIQRQIDREEDDMFTDDDRKMLQELIRVGRPSLSMLRHVGEGNVNTNGGFPQAIDGLVHPPFVDWAARYGHVNSVALLFEVAADRDPDRKADADLADAILADLKTEKPQRFSAAVAQIETTNPAVLRNYLAAKGIQA